ncbi:MAG: NAD(P)H-hydrate dehydratase [Christensenellales bacterium]|jgi:hydroxyethylthiazole kinase-like uncharacterized protein yjeF
MKAYSTDAIRQADARAIAEGTPSLTLMRRAAEGINNAYEIKGRVAIVAGLGNNGGDGIALGNILIENGVDVDLYIFYKAVSRDAGYYLNIYKNKGGKLFTIDENTSLKGYDIIVDCIFGTGLTREIDGLYRVIIDRINMSGAYVISADIPSGINGNSGRVAGSAVRADLTVSFGGYKSGHYLNDGMDYTGRLVNIDIGIKPEGGYKIISDKDLTPLFPKRQRNINKGGAGKLIIIGGSANYMGAVILASGAAAASASGAGLVTVAVPKSFIPQMLLRITGATLYPVPDKDGVICYDETVISEAINGKDAAVFGIGCGRNDDNIKIIRHLLKGRIPVLIDADGINALSENIEALLNHNPDVILTPHPKEFSRLTGIGVDNILDNPIGAAEEFAGKYNVTLLLKGSSTIITDGRQSVISTSGAPNMAKGGSGDVLSGIIGGLLARGLPAFKAAWAGAYIAGKAGEIARDIKGEYSANPEDTVNNIYKVILAASC